jgi:hypothetical protein
LIPPGAHGPPAGARRTRTACPARQLPEGARRIWSRNATSLKASLVTHRYIYFAGTLFRDQLGSWLVTNSIPSAAITDGLIFMAVTMVIIRTAGLFIRAHAVSSAATSPASDYVHA